MTTSVPLLEARGVRIDVEGVPALEGLTFATRGAHALVLGAPRALFRAAIGVVPVVRGEL